MDENPYRAPQARESPPPAQPAELTPLLVTAAATLAIGFSYVLMVLFR